MKKLLLAMGVAALAIGAVSCDKGNGSAKHEEKVLGDSLSYAFGQSVGNNIKEMMERQKSMNDGQGPELNIDKFMAGMKAVLDADTTDNFAYISGMSFALQRLFNMKASMGEDTVPFNTSLFLKGFKEIYNDTSLRAYKPSVFSDLQNRLNTLHQQKENARIAIEAAANGEAGKAYVDSVKAADTDIQVSETGLVYKIIEPGTETKANANQKIKLNYRGRTIDGKVFDETKGNPREMRMGQFIPGFNEGLEMLGEGGKAVLYIPGNLGYGERGMPQAGIKPNATLIFDIEIVEVIPEEAPAVKK